VLPGSFSIRNVVDEILDLHAVMRTSEKFLAFQVFFDALPLYYFAGRWNRILIGFVSAVYPGISAHDMVRTPGGLSRPPYQATECSGEYGLHPGYAATSILLVSRTRAILASELGFGVMCGRW
jgi:hypothetical protein